jgi:hypothetical protein
VARISFLHRRDGRYYLQVRLPVRDGETLRTRVFRSALGTSAFVAARRRLSLCMSWIVALKDHPELSQRGVLLLRQMRAHLRRGAPVGADLLAARVAMEHYVRTWLTECRALGLTPDDVCPGVNETWKAFVDQNAAAEKGRQAASEDKAFRRGFALGQQLDLGSPQGPVDRDAPEPAADSLGLRSRRAADLRKMASEAPTRDFTLHGAGGGGPAGEQSPARAFASCEAQAEDAARVIAIAESEGYGLEEQPLASRPGRKEVDEEAPPLLKGKIDPEKPGRPAKPLLDQVDLADLDEFLPEPTDSKRSSGAVHSVGLKFQGMSASMSLLGHRLAIRSRVCLAQA